MQALAKDFEEYCNDADLVDQKRYLMRIVPCGQSFDINKKYGIYFHSSDRGYTVHQYVGIYKDKAVKVIWEIDSVFDISYNNKLIKKCIQGRETDEYDDNLVAIINDAKRECSYDIKNHHRFFCGKAIDTDFVKSSLYGMWGTRLMNLKEVIGDFNDASEVAQKLTGKEWT